jgi:predicted DCC family thiol-disulfide oxidoreductase YuxK
MPTTDPPAGADALPDPDSRPDADLVIYDGHCQFCQTQVVRLARFDALDKWLGGSGRLSYISLHDPRVHERFPDLTHDDLMEQMYVVDGRGRRHGGADAIRYLSRRLRGLWPLAPILHLPLSASLWRWLYAQVARQRYRWNKPDCAGGSCEIHFGGKKKVS